MVTVNRDMRLLARELRPARPVGDTQPFWAVVGWVLRHLPELAALVSPAAGWRRTAQQVGPIWASVALAVLVVLVLVLPWTRWAVFAFVGARVTRHRLRAALVELRLTTHAGGLPIKLFIRPTPVGERVWLWLRVGISAEDLTDAVEHLRAACWARDVRVTRNRRWSALVAVDVIRRDPLASRRIIPAPVADLVVNGRGPRVDHR